MNNFRDSKIFLVIRGIFYFVVNIFYHIQRVTRKKKPKVLNIESSLEYVSQNRVSVSRFGDGELRWMLGIDPGYFQDNSKTMADRLKQILRSDIDCHVVCIPDIFGGLAQYTDVDAIAWKRMLLRYGRRWTNLLDLDKVYLDTEMTRPYIDIKNKTKSPEYFELLRKIWKNREVIIVEGSGTRFGQGNNLLNNAKSVQRILCPPENAYEKYDAILTTILNKVEINKDVLILVALGPTATILTYDLAVAGYQAIDIGHADLEYMWMLAGVEERIVVKDRYVNELKDGRKISTLRDNEYERQIIAKIGIS